MQRQQPDSISLEFIQPENDLEHQDWAESIIEASRPPCMVPIASDAMQDELRQLYANIGVTPRYLFLIIQVKYDLLIQACQW